MLYCRCTVHFVPLTDSSNASACRGPALAFLCTVFMPAVSLDVWVMFEPDKQGYSPQQHFKVLPRGSRGIAMRYVILPASTPGSSPISTRLENLQRNALRRQPNQIPKPLQLPSILRSRGSTELPQDVRAPELWGHAVGNERKHQMFHFSWVKSE